MILSVILVILMVTIEFNNTNQSFVSNISISNQFNPISHETSNPKSFLSTSVNRYFYKPNLISSFSFPNNFPYIYCTLNKSLYVPMNHDMLIMGAMPFLDPNIYSYKTGCATWNDTIVVLTPQGHEKKIVTFNNVGSDFIDSSQNILGFCIPCPYISSAVFDQSNKNIYISVPLFSNVSIFNFTTCNITGSIPVGNDPVNITVDQQTGYIYVINRYSNNLSVINPYTEKVVTSINVGISPDASIYDPYNQYLYVANSGSDSISVINTTYNSVAGTINVGSDPTDMLLDPQNQMIYVDNQKSACISVIETQYNSVEKIINLPEPLFKTNENMVYYEKTGSIYAGEDTANITVINTSRNEISRNIVTENSYYLQVFGNLTIDAYNNSLIETPEYGSCWSAVNLTTNSLGGYMWFKGATSSRLSINNPFSKSEFFISVNGNNVQVYTFNITNSITITPPDLYPLIIFVSIVLLAVAIIWRIKVRRSQYKEYIP